jgi:hypothetical protein
MSFRTTQVKVSARGLGSEAEGKCTQGRRIVSCKWSSKGFILVDTELVIPEEAVAPPPLELEQDHRGIVQEEHRAPTRWEILQDGRWRAQNWAI